MATIISLSNELKDRILQQFFAGKRMIYKHDGPSTSFRTSDLIGISTLLFTKDQVLEQMLKAATIDIQCYSWLQRLMRSLTRNQLSLIQNVALRRIGDWNSKGGWDHDLAYSFPNLRCFSVEGMRLVLYIYADCRSNQLLPDYLLTSARRISLEDIVAAHLEDDTSLSEDEAYEELRDALQADIEDDFLKLGPAVSRKLALVFSGGQSGSSLTQILQRGVEINISFDITYKPYWRFHRVVFSARFSSRDMLLRIPVGKSEVASKQKIMDVNE